MKTHSTNYTNTFIEVAEDSKAVAGEVPPVKGEKSVANLQFEMISENPYVYTSDDVMFRVYALKNNIEADKLKEQREKHFSKGQPCFRASPLAKRYGWGVHHDENEKIAIYGMETNEYKELTENPNIKKVKAMRSSRK